MENVRNISGVIKNKPTMEGAGVRLKRVFGYNEVPRFDPFLLLDDFHSDNPDDYIAGFPRHPHRGIETVTYIIDGKMRHEDSLGNNGVIAGGDVQWMTAGSGIIHSEMPEQDKGLLHGFQLWVNLPASEKMMNPKYRDIAKSQIPEIETGSGVTVKVICGDFEGNKGPARDLAVDVEYLDITVPGDTQYIHKVNEEHNVFAYIFRGSSYFENSYNREIEADHIVLFDKGDSIAVTTGTSGVRFLLISGRPINEPVAWHGPIVMNTDEELRTAFDEYNKGTFIKG